MKKQLVIILCGMALILVAGYSIGQEQLLKPKTKKVYVSEQQDIELDGDIIMCSTQMSGVLIEISRTLFLVTKAAVERVNDYACGQKGCMNKIERTDYYAKKVKIKEKIEACVAQLKKMLISFNELVDLLNE